MSFIDKEVMDREGRREGVRGLWFGRNVEVMGKEVVVMRMWRVLNEGLGRLDGSVWR